MVAGRRGQRTARILQRLEEDTGDGVGFASGTVPEPALGHPMVKNYTIAGLHWSL